MDGYTLSSTHPLIKYQSIWPIDHSCGLTSTVGGMEPIIIWETLTAAAIDTLETYGFGSAIVPFVPATFDDNLAAATF
jgi:hypothetical protein